MFEIKLNNIEKKQIAFKKNFSNDCDVFLSLMNKIDENKIARFNLNVGDFDLPMDFSYDFLSISDFLGNVLFFINNTNNIGSHKDLLFYERDDSKLRFTHLVDGNIDVRFISNQKELGHQIYSTNGINSVFKEVVTKFDQIKLCFSFSENNLLSIDKWMNSISNEIK